MIVSIKVTFAPTPISGIINGTCLEVTCYSNPSTWILTTITSTFTNFMGKDKVQETMARFAPPMIGFGSSVVVQWVQSKNSCCLHKWEFLGNNNMYFN